VDHVLVTEGGQGLLKSTALRALCPDPALFFDDEIVIGDKDAAQVLRGKWVIELGELSALSRHDLAAVKAYITRAVDCYRPSFGRVSRDFPRRCVFTASTNEAEYLKDPTGNRRFWPVPVAQRANVKDLETWRDQLWAEALTRFEEGAPWWLETGDLEGLARVEQGERTQVDPWEEHVGRWVADRVKLQQSEHGFAGSGDCGRCVACVGVTVSAVLAGACSVPKERQDRAAESRVGAILRGLGWEKTRRQIDGVRARPYLPPAPPTVPGGVEVAP
jgi:putative DNA primase/helicase